MGYAPCFLPLLCLPPSLLPRFRSSRHLLRCFGLCGHVVGVLLMFLLALARLVASVQRSSLADRRMGADVAAAQGLVVGTGTGWHGVEAGVVVDGGSG